MPETETVATPVFTEHEVNMCLQEAAAQRSMFLGRDGKYDQEDASQIEVAKTWDDLAEKVAKMAGLSEFESQCSQCPDAEKYQFPVCLYCLGTRFWPPTDAGGKRIYPELRK